MSINKVYLKGNLVADPQLRQINNTQLAKFTIAVNEERTNQDGTKKKETCFIDVDVWGREASVISQGFHKGSPIIVEGRLKLSTWNDDKGNKRSKHSIHAENIIDPNNVNQEVEQVQQKPVQPQYTQQRPVQRPQVQNTNIQYPTRTKPAESIDDLPF